MTPSLRAQEKASLVESKLSGLSIDKAPPDLRPKTLGTCLGLGVGELLLPGVGYLASGEYVKLASISSLRWLSIYHTAHQDGRGLRLLEPQSQRSFAGISGWRVRPVSFTQADLHRVNYRTLYDNLSYFSLWDLIESKCTKNPASAKIFFAPFRFGHFYKKAIFIAPMSYLLVKFALDAIRPQSGSSSQQDYRAAYASLTQRRYYGHHLFQSYNTSIGEELLFRGILQKQFYQLFRGSLRLSERWGRYLAILSSASIYALAHRSGNPFYDQSISDFGNTYNPVQVNFIEAFTAGLVLGWSFQPKAGSLDLITPIALHYWWNFLVGTLLYQNLTQPQASLSIPIVHLNYAF